MKKNSKGLYKGYKDKIVDIILFGSFIKRKLTPSDIDLAVILKNTEESELLTLRKPFMSHLNRRINQKIHLNFVVIENILSTTLLKTLLEEGFSLLKNKFIHEDLGYKSGVIFSFDLTKLKKSKKVLFSYALHGKKGGNGILSGVNGKEIGKAVVLVPINQSEEFRQFLELWNVKYYIMKVLAT